MGLSVIIPTIGDKDILLPTLSKAKKALEEFEHEIIVVNDSKGPFDLLDSRIRLLNSGGKGASHARNTGLNAAKFELLLFLDDDIHIGREHILRTLQLHEDQSAKAYNFSWTYPSDLRKVIAEKKFGKYLLRHKMDSNAHRLERSWDSLPELMKSSGLSSQYFSIWKEHMLSVGGYDPIPFAGVEDLLLFKKLDDQGVEVWLSTVDIVEQDESKRISLRRFASRYRTGAMTRKIAWSRGHKELGVNFNRVDRMKGSLGYFMMPILFRLEQIFPYGILYKKVVNFTLFASTYAGFYKDDLPAGYP